MEEMFVEHLFIVPMGEYLGYHIIHDAAIHLKFHLVTSRLCTWNYLHFHPRMRYLACAKEIILLACVDFTDQLARHPFTD